MKKSTKGAIAVAAAAVLLLGGAGSIAYWSESATVEGGTIEAGELKLDDGSCDDAWVYAGDSASAGEAVGTIVPGDSITKDCTFTIAAQGDNLEATPTLPETISVTQTAGDENPATTLELTADATYEAGGSAVTTITEANDGQTLTATITVTFPYGDDETVNANDTQNLIAELDELTVTLEQVNPNP